MTTTYQVGIDLGTTNCSVSYRKSDEEKYHQYGIHQLVGEKHLEQKHILPSFVYLPGKNDFQAEDIATPWDESPACVIGEMAKKQMERAGYRVIGSAKSWLCHSGVDRKGNNLPWGSEIDEKLSAFEATKLILSHIRESWNYDVIQEVLEEEIEKQNVVITVPASFDPAARELTMEAAKEAGFEQITLLEEPQAAFYSWLENAGDTWRDSLEIGKTVLVCDIGGGTTDFSLIKTEDDGGNLSLRRIAVGNHILLGGDNMDLALAYMAKQKLEDKGQKVDSKQWNSVISQAREAKEMVLSGKSDSKEIVVAGSGSSLFKSSSKTTLEKAEIEQVILNGFFVSCGLNDRPTKTMSAGLREIGLNFAQDAAIMKHLAEFLDHQDVKPDYILFNGSMFQSEILREKIMDCLNSWMDDAEVKVVDSSDYALAVSNGAAYYSSVVSGEGIRIKASLPFSYYIGVQKAQMAIPGMTPELSMLCIAPKGMEEGENVELPDEQFYLIRGEQTIFRLFRSPWREDEKGSRIDQKDDEFEEISSLEQTMEQSEGKSAHVPVTLKSKATEVGTIEMYCVPSEGAEEEIKLQFDVRE
jgi:molecular chaperone DnaK (HSP70)